jgi:D-alanyl-D-alanine carboxypeptidase/D-alanyl-D-alanine-endopeptidase (penicillin-binding protein 4)
LAVLAILQPDARVAARLSEALAGSHDVVVLTDWQDLKTTADDVDLDACLLDGDHPDRDRVGRRISKLRERLPDLAIIVCVEADHAERYFDLGTLGVDGVLLGGMPPTGIRSDVDRALSVARAQMVKRDLRGRLAEPGPSAVAWAVEHAGPETSVERLAAGLGLTTAALRHALQTAGLPTPGRILVWGRMLQAGARLGDDSRRAEDVAFSLGYSTSTAFGRAMKLHTGLTPAEVSRGDGIRAVLDALVERHDDDVDKRSGGAFGRHAMGRLATLAVATLLSGCATLGIGGPHVDRGAIEGVIETSPIDQIHMGILAVDAETGRTLYSRNAHRKFVPASNQKVLVTATALSLLGPDHRFRTELRSEGVRHGDVLAGDLELITSGDPSFSDRYWGSGTHALVALADSLRATGVTYVAGSGIVDVAAWDSATVGPTWEVEDLRYVYGSTGGAFAIDEGEIRVIVEAGPAVGDPARVSWAPMGTTDFVESRIGTVPADSSRRVHANYLPESRRLVLEGTIRHGTVDTVSFAQRDPVRQAVAVLASAVERAGIEVEGGWTIRWTRPDPLDQDASLCPVTETGDGGAYCEHATAAAGVGTLTFMESPPLSELIGGILKPSQNWMTEQMIRALGARYGSEGSWSEGVGVVEAYLVNEVGVDPLDISARDGSGLSAYNLVTPRAIVRILQEMREGPFADDFRLALAEPGQDGSTLERRLLEFQGRVFAKTGTISNVNSLSGYLVRNDGREVIFSVLTNGSGLPASQVRAAIDDVVRGLAR